MKASVEEGVNKQPDMRGVYATLDGLIRLRLAASELRFMPRRRALSQLGGRRDSNFRGRGIEFEEVRRYQAGDELRAIDWRVTARTGHPYTRLYREERERPTLLLIDQRQTMFFGSRSRFKSVQALNCAAALSWAALAGGDRVGGLVCSASGHHEIRPRRSRRSVLQLLDSGLQANLSLKSHHSDSGALRLDMALQELRRIAKPGSSLFLISDFHDWNAQAREQLTLLARHCEVNAIEISDALERNLPPPGRYQISDGRSRYNLDSADPDLRRAFRHRTTTQREQLRSDLLSLGAPLIEVSTHQAALETLRRYYGRQNGSSRR